MSDKNSDFEKKVLEMLEAITKMRLYEILVKELKDSKKKKLYEMTGNAKRSQIEKATGFSAGKISAIWQEWHDAGILKKDGKLYKKIFDE